jgi:DNA-binding PadR family transcriptional regulator
MMKLAGCACTGQSLPKLLRPAILGLLGRGDSHGYAINEQLGRISIFAEHRPDHAGVYRLLQTMEQEGLVVSAWDHQDRGPAKRIYNLTAKGRACLARWKRTLLDYRRTIEVLMECL